MNTKRAKSKSFIFSFLFFLSIIIPSFVLANFHNTALAATTGNNGVKIDENKYNITLKDLLFGKNAASNAPADASLQTIYDAVIRITNYALDLAGAIAFIMILYASIMYAIAYGEESKAETAKKTLTWSIIGMIVVIFSKAIMLLVQNAMT